MECQVYCRGSFEPPEAVPPGLFCFREGGEKACFVLAREGRGLVVF